MVHGDGLASHPRRGEGGRGGGGGAEIHSTPDQGTAVEAREDNNNFIQENDISTSNLSKRAIRSECKLNTFGKFSV